MYDILNRIFEFEHFKYVVLMLVVFTIINIFLFTFVSYVILKFFKTNIDYDNIFFYQYNKKSKSIIDLYGKYKVKNIYLIRQPFNKCVSFLINVFTLYNYEKLINKSSDNIPYHTLLVFEILLDNGANKMLLLEKNNCINISENFYINKTQEIKKINIAKRNLTMNEILDKTKDRLGYEKYFNWHMYKNNCQNFTKEILKSVNKYNKTNKDFIFRDKIFKIIIPSEFTLHMLNCFFIFYNIIEKYIYDTLLF
jgi:hypothetical protein